MGPRKPPQVCNLLKSSCGVQQALDNFRLPGNHSADEISDRRIEKGGTTRTICKERSIQFLQGRVEVARGAWHIVCARYIAVKGSKDRLDVYGVGERVKCIDGQQ